MLYTILMKDLGKYGIFVLCILGAITRMFYGYAHEPWIHAPDQLAWEMVIEQGDLSYCQLIHYPHEGGSILFSLFSQLLELFTSFSSLTISAFLADFVVRFVQISQYFPQGTSCELRVARFYARSQLGTGKAGFVVWRGLWSIYNDTSLNHYFQNLRICSLITCWLVD